MHIRSISISVIICSHNPIPSYLRRVIDSLREQNLSRHLWELIVVDNASTEPLNRVVDINWHSEARHLREERLGLTHARLRGIEASRGQILVFVDDDNILEPDYLEVAHWIGLRWPILGAWSGSVAPEYEIEPAEWLRRYLHLLVVRMPVTETWSSIPELNDAMPYGAGMCVRRKVVLAFRDAVREDPRHLTLDRRGIELQSCGDVDIAMFSRLLGLGTGVLADLRLRHLIPPQRLTEDYFIRLVEGTNYSHTMLLHLHGMWPNFKIPFPILTFLRRIGAFRERGPHRRIAQARIRGIVRAAREIAESRTMAKGAEGDFDRPQAVHPPPGSAPGS
jgi:glycosyltransferase involved in cell wall biosynthesis